MHRQPHLFVCPLCATPCEVEGGYDGPYYEWFCDHRHMLDYDVQPERITVAQYVDPERRELLRRVWCAIRFEELRVAARNKPPPSPYLSHARGLTYTPADRRARKEWRDLGFVGQTNAVLKDAYAEPIREALNQGSVFLAAMLGETRDTIGDTMKDMNRQSYGNEFVVPLKRG